jgi:DNA transformation protein
MFGGHGLYLQGTMFALISDDELFFKVDQVSRDAFAETDSEPFVYQSRDKQVTMSYWSAPSDAMEDPNRLLPWAEAALAAARRAGKKKVGRHEKF